MKLLFKSKTLGGNIAGSKNNTKAEDFIGWMTLDGKLEVVGILGKEGTATVFKVTCKKCTPDLELYPQGYFTSLKRRLISGSIPCGCSMKPDRSPEQFLILARRAAKDRFIVHGFAEEFHGNTTKLNLECLEDGNKWTASICAIINKGHGCPKCANRYRPTEQEALTSCIKVCNKFGYKPLGFVGNYLNTESRFEYECPVHGKHSVSFGNFVSKNTKCPSCAPCGFSPDKEASIYVTKWSYNTKSFIKFGITNRKVGSRISQQSRKTKYSPEPIWSATFDNGKIPLILENSIKNSGISIGVIDRDEFLDGFTETTNIESLDLIEEILTAQLIKLEEILI